jgi:hypothetical protein
MKMKALDLMSLIIVFDVNYASDDDYQKLAGLDINDRENVKLAVDRLLTPKFVAHGHEDQKKLLSILRSLLSDPTEDFGELFRRVALVFDDDAPEDKRAFMSALLEGLEARGFR